MRINKKGNNDDGRRKVGFWGRDCRLSMYLSWFPISGIIPLPASLRHAIPRRRIRLNARPRIHESLERNQECPGIMEKTNFGSVPGHYPLSIINYQFSIV